MPVFQTVHAGHYCYTGNNSWPHLVYQLFFLVLWSKMNLSLPAQQARLVNLEKKSQKDPDKGLGVDLL